MMMRSGLADDEPEWRGWSLEVADDRHQPRLSVQFQSCSCLQIEIVMDAANKTNLRN
jgi:hypothetical protein